MASLPDATVSNCQYVAGKALATLTILTGRYPDDADVILLRKQLNTCAILAARAVSQPDATYGGTGSDYDPPSGGTPCGPHP
jgi:hypothetical protein